MRFMHVSDLHIGKRLNGMPMTDDQRHILGQIVAIARREEVDALLVAGDIYDKAAPSAEAVTVFDAFLADAVEAGITVLAVPGNHDSAERVAFAQTLLSRQGACFPPVYDGSLSKVTLEDGHGPVDVWLVPFLKPSDVRRFFPDAEIGDDYSAALSAVLEACDIDTGRRNVAVAHQLVTAFGSAPDRADEEIKLGGIDNVDVSAFDAFDYVALGHVHRPQRVGRDTVRYSGSPLKYSFSEARHEKSVVIVDIGEKRADDEAGACVAWRTVALAPLHDMREVRMTLDELLAQASNEPGASGGEGEADDYLHVTLTDEHPRFDAMARIREVHPNVMTLDYENAALLASRDKPLAAVDPDELDMTELFARFYEQQVEKQLDDVQRAMVAQAVRDIGSGGERRACAGRKRGEGSGGAR